MSTTTISSDHSVQEANSHSSLELSNGHSEGDEGYYASKLPRFDFTKRVIGIDGMIDRFHIKTMHGYMRGDHEDIENFHISCSAPPLLERGADHTQVYGRLLRAAPYNGQGHKLNTRKVPIRWGTTLLGAPLFSGNVLTRNRGQVDRWEISSNLCLNPSTAINHRAAELLESSSAHWERLIFARIGNSECLLGLDGNENVIPSWLTLRQRRNAERRYLRAVFDGIPGELRRIANLRNYESNLTSRDHSLGDVEVYWEFSLSSAPSSLASLVPKLREYKRAVNLREHPLDVTTDRNELSVRLYLNKSTSIRLYAKLNDRLRIEVIQNPKFVTHQTCTAANFETLIERFLELKNLAADHVNALMEFLQSQPETTSAEIANSPRFIRHWIRLRGNPADVDDLLDLLQTNGRIVGGEGLNEASKAILRRARDQGLIRHIAGAYRANCP